MAQRYLGKRRRRSATRDEKRQRAPANPDQGASSQRWDNVQGEGNYKAAREFDEAERDFVESGKLDEGIRNAAPKSDTERKEMEDAEQRAKARAKEEDPALLRKPQTDRREQR